MLFRDYKMTDEFLTADVVEFINTNGNELDIDNLEDETLNYFDIEETHKKGGYLEIVLN